MSKTLALAAALLLANLAAQPPLLIKNVTVIDDGQTRGRASVLIRNGRIAAIAPSLRAGKARVVDASGQFLIAGLIDAHVHLWHEQDLPIYLAAGVTTVRDMGSDLEKVRRWRVAAGNTGTPRVETSGPPVTGPGSKGTPEMPVVPVSSGPDGRRVAEELLDRRVDFIKVLSDVPREAYFSLAERARQLRFPFEGHVPDDVTVWEAIDARQRSMEHLFGILFACSDREPELRAVRAEARQRGDTAALIRVVADLLDSYSDQRAAMLFDRLRTFGVAQAPTLTMLKRAAFIDPDGLVSDERLARVPEAIRKTWDDPREAAKQISDTARALLKRQYERNLQIVGAMHRAGVRVIAGTDTGDPYTIPGFSLHDELALLVEAGLPTAAALRAATTDAARVLGVDRNVGSIERGKLADLVLLDANPLDDIRNIARIRAVWLGGRAVPLKSVRRPLSD